MVLDRDIYFGVVGCMRDRAVLDVLCDSFSGAFFEGVEVGSVSFGSNKVGCVRSEGVVYVSVVSGLSLVVDEVVPFNPSLVCDFDFSGLGSYYVREIFSACGDFDLVREELVADMTSGSWLNVYSFGDAGVSLSSVFEVFLNDWFVEAFPDVEFDVVFNVEFDSLVFDFNVNRDSFSDDCLESLVESIS